MLISEIKDPLVRELAEKRVKENPAYREDYGHAFGFKLAKTPEGFDFWYDVRCKKDVQHYDCYPKKENKPLCVELKEDKETPHEKYNVIIEAANKLEDKGYTSAAWGVLMVLSNEIRKDNASNN